MLRFGVFIVLAKFIRTENFMANFMNLDVENSDCYDKSASKIKTWIEIINCPKGNDSENAACAGGPAPWNPNNFLSYGQMVIYAMQNYGCNCFSDNKAVDNINGGLNKHLVPGINGEPIDELDKACTILARRNKCLQIDYEGESFDDILQGRKVCDYLQGYSTFEDSDGKTYCGHEGNPLYSNESPFFQNPDNVDFFNINKCRGEVCAMDQQFIEAVAHILEDPFQFYRDNQANYNIYNDKNLCIKRSNRVMDACCGEVNFRTPYSTADKRCCDGKLIQIGSIEESILC